MGSLAHSTAAEIVEHGEESGDDGLHSFGLEKFAEHALD
jgi:hypothetical protein